MQKPLTLAYNDYINAVVCATNTAELPSFVKIIVLEKIIQELKPLRDSEYQRDLSAYEAQTKEDEHANP